LTEDGTVDTARDYVNEKYGLSASALWYEGSVSHTRNMSVLMALIMIAAAALAFFFFKLQKNKQVSELEEPLIARDSAMRA